MSEPVDIAAVAKSEGFELRVWVHRDGSVEYEIPIKELPATNTMPESVLTERFQHPIPVLKFLRGIRLGRSLPSDG